MCVCGWVGVSAYMYALELEKTYCAHRLVVCHVVDDIVGVVFIYIKEIDEK